jgi:hypothetical protein
MLMISGVTVHSFMISDLSGDTPLAWEIMRRRTRLIPLAVYSLLCDLIAVAVDALSCYWAARRVIYLLNLASLDAHSTH